MRILLVMYLLPIVVLAEEIALPIDHGIEVLHAPAALGGFLVAALILSPESLSATRAALANDLQRSINILLGSVLASIGLTIPAVLTIGLVTGKTVVLGLDPANSVLLVLTLAVSALTFISNRTNVLMGAVHLLTLSRLRDADLRALRGLYSSGFLRLVEKPKQTPFFGQRLHAGKESLQSRPVLFAFCGDQPVFVFLPGLVPPGCGAGCMLRRIQYLDIRKSGLQNQSFIFSRGTEQVEPDRTTGSDFLLRNDASDDQGVTE